MLPLFQIRLEWCAPNKYKIFVRQHNFYAGILDTEKRVFYHVPRSSKNLFHLFGKPSLGINSEILNLTEYETIKIRFEDRLLETSKAKWIKQGIVSPFCNETVDKQIILAIDQINFDEVPEKTKQLTLNFEVA